MDTDKALVIIEPAQAPQVVAVSDVSAAEIEYQRTYKAYNDLIKQIRVTGEEFVALHAKLIEAWMAENYPDLPYTIKPRCTDDGENMRIYTTVNIDSPMFPMIMQEIKEYLAQIEA